MTRTGALRYTTVDSPLGELLLVGDEHALHDLYIQGGRTAIAVAPRWKVPLRRHSSNPQIRQVIEELRQHLR